MTFFLSLLKLKIKGKLSIAFVGFATIPILLLGLITWNIISGSLKETSVRELSHMAEIINIRIGDLTEVIQMDQHLILENFKSKNDKIDTESIKVLNVKKVKEQTYNLMLTRSEYSGITFLTDSTKTALFSYKRYPMNRDMVFSEESRYSWNYYKLLVQDLPKSHMRLTPVEYMEPTEQNTYAAFSFARAYRDEHGDLEGILITDIFANEIFSIIETTLDPITAYTVSIVDDDGHYLYHSQKKKRWNQLLAEAMDHNLQFDFPDNEVDKILSDIPGMFITANGNAMFHTPLKIGALGLNKKYYFCISQPRSVLFSPINTLGLWYIGFAVLFIFIAFVLSVLATRQFVNPIRKLQEGANIISKGDLSHRIEIMTGDEIEKLAEKFNFMAEAINERDEKLKDYSTQLENRVAARTQELLDEKNKLSTIFNNIPGTLMLVDQDQTILAASTKIEQITRLSSDEVIGKKCCDVINISEMCANCSIINTNGNPGTHRQEFQITDEKNIEKTYEVYDIPIKLYSGKKAYLKILSDITHRIELQNQLLQSEKLASTGEMAAVIAHEIRNLLTSTDMLLQLLRESDTLKASDKESLDVVLNATSRINKITEDLLSFARPTTLNKQRIKFGDLIHECMKLYQHQFKSHNIHTELDIQKNLPRIQIDYTLMSEAVSNVLLNTYQALGNKGNVKISVRYFKTQNDFKKSVNISEIKQSIQNVINLEQTDGIIMLTIIDDGPGIPKENLLKIFDPFYTTKINGTGLGLSMARRVVETHDGIIFASSEESQGTTITMILPLRIKE
ncbi:MAG: HAMP domain-containing protein [Candidatus Marinimicrobia bacterium]|nr:HAMP domain-containing protein [Candidatus Neomarinimicrobiota bacterium]